MSSLAAAIALPDALRAREASFELSRAESINPALGGTVDAFERATPRFTLEIQSGPLKPAELQAWRAWFLKLRGGQNTFLAWDPWAERPFDWPASTDLDNPTADSTAVTADSTTHTTDETVFGWGNPRLTAVDASARTISLSDFTAGATVKAGDPISWDDGTNRRRVVAVADATASASGVISGLAVEPAPVAPSSYPVRVDLYRAACEMRVDPASIRVPLNYRTNGQVSFAAYQIIRSV